MKGSYQFLKAILPVFSAFRSGLGREKVMNLLYLVRKKIGNFPFFPVLVRRSEFHENKDVGYFCQFMLLRVLREQKPIEAAHSGKEEPMIDNSCLPLIGGGASQMTSVRPHFLLLFPVYFLATLVQI